MRDAFLIDVRRVHSVFNEGRLVLDRLVHDGVELMIRHDRKHVGHQLVLGLKILIMFGWIRGPLPSLLRAPGDFGKSGDRMASSRDLNGGLALLLKYTSNDSSPPVGLPARFPSNSLSLGMTIGSTSSAPAALSSATALSKTSVIFLKSSESGSEPSPIDSRKIPMRAPFKPS